MANYSTDNLLAGTQQNLTSSFQTLLSLNAATGAASLKRGWIYELFVGPSGSPNAITDCSITWDVSRLTAAGTATSATPNPFDGADTAAGLVAMVNYTAEPTISAAASLLPWALNQRNSRRWKARDEKAALVIPATNVTGGLAIRALSPSYTGTGVVTAFHRE